MANSEKKIPRVDIDCTVTINGNTTVYQNYYIAFKIASSKTPKNKQYTIDERLYNLLHKYPDIYADFVDNIYTLYLCSGFEGLFPRIYLAGFKDPVDMKNAIKFMNECFNIRRKVRYHQDCI